MRSYNVNPADLRPAKIVHHNLDDAFWPEYEGMVGFATAVNKFGNVGFYKAPTIDQIDSFGRVCMKACDIQYID